MGRTRAQTVREIALILVILTCLGIVGLTLFGGSGLFELRRRQAELGELQRQVRQLQQENAALRARLNVLETEPGALDQEIRRRLPYARPGETVYHVLPPQEER